MVRPKCAPHTQTLLSARAASRRARRTRGGGCPTGAAGVPKIERGTLNLIDEAAVLAGVAAARQGRVFSLAIPFDPTGPQWDNVNMPNRTNPELQTHTVNLDSTGDARDFTTSDDSFQMGSQAATHWDALSPVGYEGLLYNNVPDTAVSSRPTLARPSWGSNTSAPL